MNYIDLSYSITSDIPVYPGDMAVEIEETNNVVADGFSMHNLAMGMHVGTHMDAPAHFIDGGKSIADLELGSFIGVAKILRYGEAFDYEKICPGDIVILKSGFEQKWGTEEYFKKYPVVPSDLVDIMVKKQAKMLCVDMPSVDYAPHEVHKELLKHEILIVENLRNLGAIPERCEIRVFALPMRIQAEAAACRVIAEISYQSPAK